MNEPTENEIRGLIKFARVVLQDAFEGQDFSGADAQDLAEKLGLLVEAPDGYDPEKHGASDYADEGDRWFEFAPFMRETP